MNLEGETSNGKLKIAESVILGSAAAVIFITAITVAADLAPPLKDWLKNTFNHHWIGKSIISVIVFVSFSVFTFVVPYKACLERINNLVLILLTLVSLGTLVIFGFFSWETFLK